MQALMVAFTTQSKPNLMLMETLTNRSRRNSTSTRPSTWICIRKRVSKKRKNRPSFSAVGAAVRVRWPLPQPCPAVATYQAKKLPFSLSVTTPVALMCSALRYSSRKFKRFAVQRRNRIQKSPRNSCQRWNLTKAPSVMIRKISKVNCRCPVTRWKIPKIAP